MYRNCLHQGFVCLLVGSGWWLVSPPLLITPKSISIARIENWSPPGSYSTQPTAAYSHDRGQDHGHVEDPHDPQIVDLISQLKAS